MFSTHDHTFVVCAYKESPYLQECVDSLLAQTERGTVLMATATPNDHIATIARNAGIELLVNDASPGIGSDWNYAVSCADTPLVTLAHQDDTYQPDYVQVMLRAMNKASQPLIFFSDYGELRDDQVVDFSQLLRVKRLLLRPLAVRHGVSGYRHVKRSILKYGNAICCPSVTLNMNMLPNPPFNVGMGSNLDWDAWERFSRMDGEFVYANQVLMHHRIHQGSTTSALIQDNTRTAEDLEMLQRFWPGPIARALNLVYARGQKSNG